MKINFKQLMQKFFVSFIWLAILLIAVDQATKIAAHFGNWNVTLIKDFLHIHLARNTGAAWSILSGKMWLLAIISAVVGTLIIVYRVLMRNKLTPLKKAIIAVILAGTWGNFIDRAFYKLFFGVEGVVDFIHFQFGTYHFPIFNVADICVTLGIIGYAILIFVEDYLKGKKEAKIAAVTNEVKEDVASEDKEELKEEDVSELKKDVVLDVNSEVKEEENVQE